MKILSSLRSRALGVGLSISLLSAGCGTVEFRRVQSDFEAAVKADNAASVSPFTEVADSYAGVLAKLTPAYIAGIEPRLRPNAWMLRAVSAWRSRLPEVARESRRQGLADPNLAAHSRDAVILRLIPALLIDSDLEQRYRLAQGAVSTNAYREFEKDFATALGELESARREIAESTPDATRWYVEFQHWRLLQNWRVTLAHLPKDDVEARDRARESASKLVGEELAAAADRHKRAIPPGHELSALIVSLESMEAGARRWAH